MNIPCSKSYAQRYILVSLFSKTKAKIYGLTEPIGNDIISSLKVAETLGAKLEFNNGCLAIDPSNVAFDKDLEIDCGESGTLARILIPLLASYEAKYTITGQGSLLNRNLDSIKDFFDKSEVEFNTNNGKLPIKVCGKHNNWFLYDNSYVLDGSETSQYISGIIIAYALRNEYVKLSITNCSSIDYIKITVDALNHFGYLVDIEEVDETQFVVTIKHTNSIPNGNKEVILNVELDWSSLASYLSYCMAMRKTNISFENASYKSCQCDKKILDIAKQYYDISEIGKRTYLKQKENIHYFTFDCSTCPDLFPVVCALAATCKFGYSKITGLDKLVNKESNRGLIIYEEFKKHGIDVSMKDNSLYIKGTNKFNRDVEYNSHNDHRIAMALIIIRKYYKATIPQDDPCLSKSYPNFIEDINE